MSDAERFDAFYSATRDRILVLAFALTGDLPASRGAVRDTYIAAWHHWAKVKRLDDPEAWVRPYVWSHAQRRHSARIWHRDRRIDPEVRATLDALAKLPATSRKALLLTQLTSTSRQQMAREVGLPLAEAEQRLQSATTQFSLQREVPSSSVRPLLDGLVAHCADQRWPRATIVRRSGTTRRRTHALAGAALVVVALVGGGLLVTDDHGVRPTLTAAGNRITSVPAEGAAKHQPPGTTSEQITPASLLSTAQMKRAVPGRRWRITGTDPQAATTLPCQRRAYADPKAPIALVRNFTAHRSKGQPQLAAVQTMELSSDAHRAVVGFDAATGWFAECLLPQTQLLSVRRVHGLGDQAMQFALRAWKKPAVTLVIGVARTGRITTVTLTRTAGAAAPNMAANLRILVSAVDDLCPTTVGGHCSALPKAVPVDAPTAGDPPMMLSAFDLPPAAGVQSPWAGTTPRQAVSNLAATGCDASRFHGGGWRHDATRTFLVPQASLAPAFGLTETVGRLPQPKARAFVDGMRSRLASCSDRQLGTKVLRMTGDQDMTVWRVRTKVTDKKTVTFMMGVIRHGGAVAQVGFVPDGAHTMTTQQFAAVVRRAGQRLAAMPS
jgi:DNA-directed RNA polymerase specialized sigma24 family protein